MVDLSQSEQKETTDTLRIEATGEVDLESDPEAALVHAIV